MDSRVVLMCQNFVITFSTHNCAVMVPAGILSGGDGRGSGLCGFLPSQNMKSLRVILKAHSLPVLCILAGRAGLWVLPAWLPVPASILACDRLPRHCLLFNLNTRCCLQPCSALFLPIILCSLHCSLWHLQLDILQSACHPSGVLKHMGMNSSSCSQVDRENVPCVTLCVPAWLF